MTRMNFSEDNMLVCWVRVDMIGEDLPSTVLYGNVKNKTERQDSEGHAAESCLLAWCNQELRVMFSIRK